jgi:hypothetical protein
VVVVVTGGVVVDSKVEASVALVAAWVLVAAGVVSMAREVLVEVAASPPETEVSDFRVQT